MYHADKLIFAFGQIPRNIKFRRVVRAFAVSDIFPVDVNVQTGRNAEKTENIFLCGILKRKGLAVNADRHVFRDFRRH